MSGAIPFTFGIPLMPRAAASNWDIVEALLETTLASVLAQSDPDISIIIAGHDRPARLPRDDRVRFIETPSPARPPSAGNVDRGLKAFAIADEVLANDGGFLALVDADDWVDRRFAETARAILDAPEIIGGYLTAGYLIDIASLKVAALPDPRLFDGAFVELCGSSIVARLRPEEDDPLRRNPHRVLHEHHRWGAAAASHPNAIIELPLRNAYAVNTSENHSEHLSAHALWRRELNAGVNRLGAPITPAIAADFGLTIERLATLSRMRRGVAQRPDAHDGEQTSRSSR